MMNITADNLSVYAIPLAWSICMLPHGARFACMVAHQGFFKYDNENPRATNTDEVFKNSPGKAAFVKRCKAAHENGLETLPLFSAAVLLARTCGVTALRLNPLLQAYLASRLVYSVLYMGNVNPLLAFARSGAWFFGIATIFEIFHLCALKVGANN